MSCPDCGLDTSATMPADAIASLRSFARRFQAPLTRFLPGEDGHAVLSWTGEGDGHPSILGLASALADDLGRIRQQVRGATGNPGEEGPAGRHSPATGAEAAGTLGHLSLGLADDLESLEPDAWQASVDSPAGGTQTVLDLSREAVHAGHHQLLVVGRALRAAREAGVGRR